MSVEQPQVRIKDAGGVQVGSSESMGLVGWAKTVANLTAVGVVCWLVMQSQDRLFDDVKETRAFYRDELKEVRGRYDQVRKDHARMLFILEDLLAMTRQSTRPGVGEDRPKGAMNPTPEPGE